ncbi:hypothetical protein AURDEDRAFT_175375 [Auricularia subglabra TFB-10046 SS5]|uniref:F-box domain-containing protein n=1 Tax=Auricularia subglabra (strain TFB-10046 / SS5) TaxID=717982 RepID=J0CXP4_AURST|nr:hypothetical protein AURDEDRAFT_175375 [Auricularia subglabra TFB-10046 SS5]
MHEAIQEPMPLIEMWQRVADFLDREGVRSLSFTTPWFRNAVSGHVKGYFSLNIPAPTYRNRLTEVSSALDYADRAMLCLDVVAVRGAIQRIDQALLERIAKSSDGCVGIDLDLPLDLLPHLDNLVRRATRLRSLHIDITGWDVAPFPKLDFSRLLQHAPTFLTHFSLVCEGRNFSLPDNLNAFTRLRSVQLSGEAINGKWPEDWKAAVSSLGDRVSVLNIRISSDNVDEVELTPLLRGLGNRPLHVAFPDTCEAPGQFMVSTADGSFVRRLRWGDGDATEGLTVNIAMRLAPVAAQVVAVHIDSRGVREIIAQPPMFPNLGSIVVHTFIGPEDTEDLDLAVETAEERAERLALAWEDEGYDSPDAFIEDVRKISGSIDEVRVDLWCQLCGDMNAFPPELSGRATATPGPSA